MHDHQHHHDSTLVLLSILIAIFASYTALDLASSISNTRGKIRWMWLLGGSLAMGIGIWSMHFIGMLAFSMPGLDIYYDVPLLLLSIAVAILASALALYMIGSKEAPSIRTYTVGSLLMGAAIAGMHYIGIWSMEMAAEITWDMTLVYTSIGIAVVASFGALLVAFKLRNDISVRSFIYRGVGGSLMGFAIAGMHYTGMAGMHITPKAKVWDMDHNLLASNNLATVVIIGTLMILSIALSGSNIDRVLARKTSLNDALKEAIRSRDVFMSVASHELKTPLTSIKLQNEMILRNAKKNHADVAKMIVMLEKTDKNINRLNRLVDDMLDISRLSSERMALQKEAFDLALLATEVIERLAPLTEEAQCRVIFQGQKEVVGQWDRFRIEQVITNLVTNAAKYASGKPIYITVDAKNATAQLRVKDEGRGIDPKDHERIFKRFERAEEADSLRGLGLGLFIVKEIVNRHQGLIKILSEKDAGAEFIVELPLTQPS